MAKQKKFSNEEIEEQYRNEQIPYDYDTKQYPIEVLYSKFEKGLIYVPEYQRAFVWDTLQRSRFIESVLLGVPIMPFFVSSVYEQAGKLEIIDGSQRIRTICSFINNEFSLRNLRKLVNLEGLKFKNLPEFVQNEFFLRDMRFHVITTNADFSVRADIFDRINTSGKKLTDSEIRKGAYQGDFYNFILDCSNDKLFRKVCPMSDASSKRGEYEELTCRFFTYSERYKSSKHEVAGFINKFIEDKIQFGFDKTEMRNHFNRMLTFVHDNFAPLYFARTKNVTPRVRFEAISVGVHLALEEKPSLVIDNIDWIESEKFKTITTSDASNNPGRLKERIEFVRDSLLGRI